MRHRTWLASLFALSIGCGGATQVEETTAQPEQRAEVETGSIEAAIAGAHRPEEQRARDRYRHPAETLAFFGLRPDMTVIEIQPGGGWYTAVLAPVLRDHGRLIVTNGDPNAEGEQGRFARELLERFHQRPDIYDQVQTELFDPPAQIELGEPGSADLVLTFRSAHNWIRRGYEQQMFDAMARVLKPGGVLGIVQHRAPEGSDPHVTAEQGYVPEAYIIELAEHAGLRLDARSDINANPADTHDHPNGVWSLPPSLRGGDVDRDAFVAVGESDRMTLRFVKPAE